MRQAKRIHLGAIVLATIFLVIGLYLWLVRGEYPEVLLGFGISLIAFIVIVVLVGKY